MASSTRSSASYPTSFLEAAVFFTFTKYKEKPENTGFSGFLFFFRYSLELSLAELRCATSSLEAVLN